MQIAMEHTEFVLQVFVYTLDAWLSHKFFCEKQAFNFSY